MRNILRYDKHSRPLIRRPLRHDLVVQLKILRGFELGHVVKLAIIIEISAAAKLQGILVQNIFAMAGGIHPLFDDGLSEGKIGVGGNQRAVGRITERAFEGINEIDRRIGLVLNAKVCGNIFREHWIFYAG